jgi:hypothetical protein
MGNHHLPGIHIDSILHVDFQPNLEDSDTQVDGMLFHIERSFHKAQSICMDQDIDSQYMLCYLDNRYHVDIPPFVFLYIVGTDLLQNQEDMYKLLCDFQQSK